MIKLWMNELKYENDVRALLMAFYHGEKIIVNPGLELPDPDNLYLCEMHIEFDGDKIKVSVSDADNKKASNADEANVDAANAEVSNVDTDKVNKKTVSDEAMTVFADYKQAKNDLKRLVYKVLCAFTGRTLPWGTLTGIRPTKISMQLLDEGMDDVQMRRYFDREYKISDAKYRLCTQVAKNERRILEHVDYKKGFSLYTGIPFCPTICAYCSFSSFPLSAWKNKVDDYLDALCHEVDQVSAMLGTRPTPLTFYMGGGTPTSLNPKQLDRILTKLEKCFDLDKVCEKTIEAGRPDSITEDKLRVIRDHGITRISINPQTMNQKTLDAIGRRHTIEEVRSAFELARKCGFDNINMDLIAGLPGENADDFAYTLSEIKKMAPESLTVHALAIKRAALVNREKLYLQSASVEEVNDMINMAFETAASMGHEPYYLYRQKNIAGNLENVGYALPGYEALYNILIMEEKQSIVALGAGASTKIVHHGENRIERIENVKSVKDYIERNDEMILRKNNNLTSINL